LKARGVPITGVGIQMHVLIDWSNVSVIEQSMGDVANRGLKVKMAELGVLRVNNHDNSSAPVYTSLTDEAVSRQKKRYREIIATDMRTPPSYLRAGITV
jgi:GH35 family endo-1,4-beta-xylanase